MRQSPFWFYYTARKLENLPIEDQLLPVFASSDIKVYPFQIAAANFALRSPYQKGAILCDEAGMGKSHEAMMVIVQRWYEGGARLTGSNRILLCIPNADLLRQWVELIDRYYTVPYVVLANRADWNAAVSAENPNAFEQDAIILTTNGFAVEQAESATAVSWDLTVFEEASTLSSVYQADNRQAKALKRIAGDSFKLLLTGTPIEKNIMDLYGLIYFIDENILPTEQEFLQRYLRRPENYHELSLRVSKYCFRTLRAQAKQYAKLPNRIPVTFQYALSLPEQELYDRLFDYCNRAQKQAFPDMSHYDLSLRLLGLQGSSTAAILQTIRGVIRRLETMPDAQDELQLFRDMERLAKSIRQDAKTGVLLLALDKGFRLLKQVGANQKALIFTESAATQKYLYDALKQLYRTALYSGSADYSAIQEFRNDAQILISTDNGARGFNLEECAFVIQYDLLYNTLKMEQRIDRSHRLGQQNDVVSLSFIDKNNFADVRKLELCNKRMLVADGVFGISDMVIGGFTDDLDEAFTALSQTARTRGKIDASYQNTLEYFETENRQIVSAAEDVLFTTFTRELANRLKLTPKYITDRAEEISDDLWQLVKWFFVQRNDTHNDCYFAIDEKLRTVTAQNYETLPVLFYYWNGSRNQKYHSLKSYGMAKDFKPRHGRITLTSIIACGILHEMACADSGTIQVEQNIEPCALALYQVLLQSGKSTVRELPVLVGRTQGGTYLDHETCETILQLPIASYAEDEHTAPCWLRTSSSHHTLDNLVPTDALIQKQASILSDVQTEEVERIKLRAMARKSDISHAVDDLQAEVRKLEGQLAAVSGDRMKTILLQRELSVKRGALLKKQDSRFFEQMQQDVELEQRINKFLGKEKLTAKVVRQFVIKMEVLR